MVSSLWDIPLSVLDTSPIVEGSTAREALGKTQDLARLVDRLGYHRYWVPEHHSMRGVASAAPAVVVAQLQLPGGLPKPRVCGAHQHPQQR